MRLLTRHPDTPCAVVRGIEVEVARPAPGRLALRYILVGATGDLVLPPPAETGRADGLWRHTCFEAFVGPLTGESYCEFNLAPSTEWAAYRFDGYRLGMAPADIAAPQITVKSTGDGLALTASLDLARTALPADAAWRLGLSAVIESVGGAISYWALAHPPGKPDFHHPDCFALELPAPLRP